MSRSEIIAKVAKSNASAGGGNNLRDGRGRLVVKRLSFDNGFNGDRFSSEFIVFGSNKIAVTELKTGKALDIEPNAIGTDVSVVQMLDKHENAWGNVKGFVLALFGVDGSTVTEKDLADTLDEITSSENAAAGMVIDFDTYRKVTKKNSVEIVIPRWYRVPTQNIAEMRAWMESLTIGQTGAVN